VSGSIEAARVGEFGVGFRLFRAMCGPWQRRPERASGRIKDIVRAIQNQIRKVSTIVEIASRRSGEAASRAGVAASGIGHHQDIAHQVSSGVEAISAAMSETAMAVQQANQASEQIATAAEEVSRSTSEAASAAEQASKAAAEIADAVEEIASQADDLQSS
jgi:methyl-accepting chemotaxis protein